MLERQAYDGERTSGRKPWSLCGPLAFARFWLENAIVEYDVTQDERALFDDVSSLAGDLWAKSLEITGRFKDPKIISAMLFKRLWSNHRGYALLWNNRLQLESDIVLRSAIEASICLAANAVLKDEFAVLLHRDAAQTILGQIKLHRANGDLETVRDAEAVLRDLKEHLAEDAKPVGLNWQSLSEQGGVPHLYAWYRMLSGTSSHVTGASILTSVTDASGPCNVAELLSMQRKLHFVMMAGATLRGSMRHAGVLDDEPAARCALDLTNRLSDLSYYLPGVGG